MTNNAECDDIYYQLTQQVRENIKEGKVKSKPKKKSKKDIIIQPEPSQQIITQVDNYTQYKDNIYGLQLKILNTLKESYYAIQSKIDNTNAETNLSENLNNINKIEDAIAKCEASIDRQINKENENKSIRKNAIIELLNFMYSIEPIRIVVEANLDQISKGLKL